MSQKSNSFRWFQAPLAALVCLVLDFWSKRWAESNLHLHETKPFIEGFLNLNLTSNTGAAFSIGKDFGLGMTALATLVTIGIIAWYIVREREEEKPPALERIGIGCVLGGALGNLIDRYSKGSVTDFLDFAFVEFPVFNVADALINVGIGFILIAHLYFLFKEKSSTKIVEAKESSE